MIYTEHLCTRPLYDALDYAELRALHEVGMMQPIMMPLPPACLTYNHPSHSNHHRGQDDHRHHDRVF